jgi:autotransporter-associated beta strand protein
MLSRPAALHHSADSGAEGSRLGKRSDVNPAFRQLFTSTFIPNATPEQVQWFNDLQRMTTSPDNALRLRIATGEIDVRPLFSQIQAPTLVMHSRGDAAVEYDRGRALAAAIPDARFVTLDSDNHLLIEGERAWPQFLDELRRFLGGLVSPGPTIRPLFDQTDSLEVRFLALRRPPCFLVRCGGSDVIRNLSSLQGLVPSGRTALPALTLLTLTGFPVFAARAEEGADLSSTTSGSELSRSEQELGRSDQQLPVTDEARPSPDEEPARLDDELPEPTKDAPSSDEEAQSPEEEPPSSDEEPARPDEGLGRSGKKELDTSKQGLDLSLTEGLLSFVEKVSALLNDRSSTPPPNNTYSYETGFSSGLYPEPPVYLSATNSHSAIASTDCSGWLSYALDTTAPLHRAALQSQRRLRKYNRGYEGGFLLQEAGRLWSRAFVVTHFLRADYAREVGFVPIERLEQVRRGDIVAYALGRYAEPTNTSLYRTGDSGHVFIAVGTPKVVSKKTHNYDGYGSLSERAAKVIAVPGLDSSSIPHFDPDSRSNKEGRYELPLTPWSDTAYAGGIGTGTIWFAVDDAGEVLQARIGPRRRYHDVVAGAAQMSDTIALIPEITDRRGDLLIESFDNTPSHFGKQSYGHVPVRLTGPGGVRVAGDGAVILNGDSDFSGGVKVESGAVIVQSSNALGTGPVTVSGGALILERPALADDSVFRVSGDLHEGAIRLEFTGEDVVRAVLIGDHAYLCGTLGSAESGAMHQHPAFSGPGVLRVARRGFPCLEYEVPDAAE